MNAIETKLSGVTILESQIHRDSRGCVWEPFNKKEIHAFTSAEKEFVQQTEMISEQAVLRGLSYQRDIPRTRLIRVVRGQIFSVALDVRKNSKTFGHWDSHVLSEECKKIIVIPPGIAHGFLTLSTQSVVLEMSDAYFQPQTEEIIRYDDPILGINWPLIPCEYPIALGVTVSEKALRGKFFNEAIYFE